MLLLLHLSGSYLGVDKYRMCLCERCALNVLYDVIIPEQRGQITQEHCVLFT